MVMRMENLFDDMPEKTKKRLVEVWKSMTETDKTHFINQVSLALSIWGSDIEGKRHVVSILSKMINNDCSDLSDFGLYVEDEKMNSPEKTRRASDILESYRMKNALSCR